MSDELTSSKTNPNVQFQVIYHYFLWNSRVEDDWRIEAVFGREFCKEFTRCDRFGGSSDFGATVYRLEHQIPIPKDRFSDASAHRESYRIRMTLRTARNPDQCCDTEEIFINPSIQHKFFFGFNFSNPTFSSTAKSKRKTNRFRHCILFCFSFLHRFFGSVLVSIMFLYVFFYQTESRK